MPGIISNISFISVAPYSLISLEVITYLIEARWRSSAASEVNALRAHRNRFSKPFITLVTEMSAIIPSAIPAIEKKEIKEIKPLPLASLA